jgi:hypothetical protein
MDPAMGSVGKRARNREVAAEPTNLLRLREIGGRYGDHDIGRIGGHYCVGPSGQRSCGHENSARQYCLRNMIEHEFLPNRTVPLGSRSELGNRA